MMKMYVLFTYFQTFVAHINIFGDMSQHSKVKYTQRKSQVLKIMGILMKFCIL
jgi:hypothetical protein